jgi:hypothetical protein
MMIGYSPDHPTGTYRMFDPNTRGVHMTCDVTWLRRKFFPSTLLEAGEGVVTPLGQHEEDNHGNDDDDDEDDNHGDGDDNDDDNADTRNCNRNEDEDGNYGTHDDFVTRSGRRSPLPAYLRAAYETSNTGQDSK